VRVERGRVRPAFAEQPIEGRDGRAAHFELDVVPRRPLAVGVRHRKRLGVAEVAGVVAAGVAEVDAARERDVAPRVVRMAQHHELLVVGAGAPHPFVEQHLTAGVVHHVAEPAVLLLAVGQVVVVRAPHQALDDDSAARGVAEELADRGLVRAQTLVCVATPVGEEQVVARLQRPDLRRETGEIRGTVHERHHPVAGGPGGQPVGGVAPLCIGQEPVLGAHRHPCTVRAGEGPVTAARGGTRLVTTASFDSEETNPWRPRSAPRPLTSA
jgi:hypothetical protein